MKKILSTFFIIFATSILASATDIYLEGSLVTDDTYTEQNVLLTSGALGAIPAQNPTKAASEPHVFWEMSLNDDLFWSVVTPSNYATGNLTIMFIFIQTEDDATSKEAQFDVVYSCGLPGDVVNVDTDNGALNSGDIVQPDEQWKTFYLAVQIPAADFSANTGCNIQLERVAIDDGVEMDEPGQLWVGLQYTAYKVHQ